MDKFLFWIFLFLASSGTLWSALAFYKAIKNSDSKADPEGIRMFFWAFGGLIGLIVAGMSVAYILWPIIFNYAFR